MLLQGVAGDTKWIQVLFGSQVPFYGKYHLREIKHGCHLQRQDCLQAEEE